MPHAGYCVTRATPVGTGATAAGGAAHPRMLTDGITGRLIGYHTVPKCRSPKSPVPGTMTMHEASYSSHRVKNRHRSSKDRHGGNV
jgi:hypothetical protein